MDLGVVDPDHDSVERAASRHVGQLVACARHILRVTVRRRERILAGRQALHHRCLHQTTAGESPYWPGTVLFIEDDKPPRLESLLAGVSHEDLGARDAYS
jgi:hypothetical protein